MIGALEGSGYTYAYGQSAKILYRVGGSSMEWLYYKKGVNYTYTFELPPKAIGGSFRVPTRQIKPIGEHVGNMIYALGSYLTENHYPPIYFAPDVIDNI